KGAGVTTNLTNSTHIASSANTASRGLFVEQFANGPPACQTQAPGHPHLGPGLELSGDCRVDSRGAAQGRRDCCGDLECAGCWWTCGGSRVWNSGSSLRLERPQTCRARCQCGGPPQRAQR